MPTYLSMKELIFFWGGGLVALFHIKDEILAATIGSMMRSRRFLKPWESIVFFFHGRGLRFLKREMVLLRCQIRKP